MIYMRAGYIAVLGTLFLYACLLSWRKHRLTQAVGRAEAFRNAGRPAPAAPTGETLVGETLVGETLVGETLVGETLVGETLWRQAGAARADAAPSLDGSSVAREAPSLARLEVPPEVGR
ncbi:MAG: hypothetical protein M0Z93_08095 [Actinomycetota bacterium]|nr:hypothetical protein [Actinomycetota bacterium]